MAGGGGWALEDMTVVKGASREEAGETKQTFLLCRELVMASCPLRTLEPLWLEPAF